MVWRAEPYTSATNPILYVSGQIAAGSHPVHHQGPFVSMLTNLTRSVDDIHVADLTSELIFNSSAVDNSTGITCQTYRGNQPLQTSTHFYHAGRRKINSTCFV